MELFNRMRHTVESCQCLVRFFVRHRVKNQPQAYKDAAVNVTIFWQQIT
jgi:hypothetical protein